VLELTEHEEQSAFTARSKKKTEVKDGNTTDTAMVWLVAIETIDILVPL
jgi:hypothetical protein